jgi:transposase InsO family protein
MQLLDAALVAFTRHGAMVFDEAGGFGRWCDAHGIARATGYRHRARIAKEGCWQPRSTRPRWSPRSTPIPVRAEIVLARSMLGIDNGAANIRIRLQQVAAEWDWTRLGWTVPSRATIHKILVQEGLVDPQPKKRPKSSYRRFVYARPRDCYQIDATVVGLAGPLRKAVVFEVIDDHSRVLVASKAAEAETTDAAVAAIQAAFTTFGVPAIVLSDNGSAFTGRGRSSRSRFTRTVTTAGARLIHSSPYHPQTCGKVERHHRTFKAWLTTQDPPTTLAQLQTLCDTYQHWYNTTRPHSAVAGPPQQAWDRADSHGGPQHLPAQTDAIITRPKVEATGVIQVGGHTIYIGRPHIGHTITAIRDGDHITAYRDDGTPLGHLTLDRTRRHQGKLRNAA